MALVTMVGAALGVAIVTVLVVTVPSLRKATLDAARNALWPRAYGPIRSDIGAAVGTSALTMVPDHRTVSGGVASIGASPVRVPALEPSRSARLGYFVIETEHAERTRLLVEMFLERETKRWRLDGSTGTRSGNGDGHGRRSPNGRAVLMYLVRFRRNTPPATVLERLSAVGQPTDFTVRLEADSDDTA